MYIAVASDHNGIALADDIAQHLRARGFEVDRLGPTGGDEPVDYPPIVATLAESVRDGVAERGVMVGGTGSGESVAANKVRGIRAVLASDHLTARIAREHNDAHILVLGAMVVGPRLALELVDAFIDARFLDGRHVPRLGQLAALERGENIGEGHPGPA